MVVYLLTTGDGSDGDEWYVQAICATPEAWQRAKATFITERGYDHSNEMEEWEVIE